jgi:HAD superfamily hydrolase (TIGR01450 family)
MASREILERIARTNGVMFDIDGCLVISDGPSGQDGRILDGAREAIELIKASGRKYCVYTNGTAQTPAAIAAHLRSMGIDIPDELVLTPAVVAAEVIKETYGDAPIMMFGGPGMRHDFEKRNINLVDIDAAIAGSKPEVAAVVIGWDTQFGKDKIQIAAEAILSGARLYCASYSPAFASKDRLNVGVSGFITSGLLFVTQTSEFEILGKPSQHSMNVISRLLDTPIEQILVIGDDLFLESSMARKAGAFAGIVLTGTSKQADVDAASADVAPELVVNTMTEFVELFTKADAQFRQPAQ